MECVICGEEIIEDVITSSLMYGDVELETEREYIHQDCIGDYIRAVSQHYIKSIISQ